MRKYSRESRRMSTAERFFKTNKKGLTVIGVIAAVVVVAVIAVSALATKQGFDTSFLVTRDTVKIGLRTDVPGFGSVDENGMLTGFDREYIDAVLRELLGDQEKVYEYYTLTSQDAAGEIKYGTVDIALGLLTSGTDKTKGFTLTKPYYTDDVVLVMRKDSRVQSIREITAPAEPVSTEPASADAAGGEESPKPAVGLLVTAVPSGDFAKQIKDMGLDMDIIRYSDYESAMLDIDAGRISAVAMPRAVSKQFESADYRIVAEPVGQVGYSIMLPTGQGAVETEFNRVIDKFEADGTTQALMAKWGIAQ